MTGASPFPRHWAYDYRGHLIAKSVAEAPSNGSCRPPSCAAAAHQIDRAALARLAEQHHREDTDR
jgi:hypothetical protein